MSHDQREIFNRVSYYASKITTNAYSTSFSAGIKLLDKRFRDPIYAIYGFVRFADEIVDTFHLYNKQELMRKFRADAQDALNDGISMNPILNSFQNTCSKYEIGFELVDTFLKSMEMDLEEKKYDRLGYENYILGSAEVVGLMCLKVFTEGNSELYESLRTNAMSLGAAFQKINFLRDIKADFEGLGRMYFPLLDFNNFSEGDKKKIEDEIEENFHHAYQGIKKLPKDARLGVLIAYVYYKSLFVKIKAVPSHRILEERIRIPNQKKFSLIIGCYVRNNLNML